MSIKKLIALIGIIALALVLISSNSSYLVVLHARQQQHSTNIQNTNGTMCCQHMMGMQNMSTMMGKNMSMQNMMRMMGQHMIGMQNMSTMMGKNMMGMTTQKTDRPLGGYNRVSILPDVPADRSFSPNVINVKRGDNVTWTNSDVMPHTVTSGTGLNDPNKGKEFDSGLPTPLMPGKTFSHRFTIAGGFPYFCQLHPAMAGAVSVT